MIGCGAVGVSILKSFRLGDMWHDAPESRTKGDPCSTLWAGNVWYAEEA